MLPPSTICVAPRVRRTRTITTTKTSLVTISTARQSHPSKRALTSLVHRYRDLSGPIVTSMSALRGTLLTTRTKTSYINAALFNCARTARTRAPPKFSLLHRVIRHYTIPILYRKKVTDPTVTHRTLSLKTCTIMINATVANVSDLIDRCLTTLNGR